MLSILLLSACLQGAPSVPTAEPPSTIAGDQVALESALLAVREAGLRADLGFLASDEMRGRNTPSPELRLAALYLRSRVQRMGFTPGAEDGWLYPYSIYHSILDAEQSFVEARSARGAVRLDFGRDYFFLLSSHAVDQDVQAGLICAGSGSADELEQVDLKGRWALVLETGRVARKAVSRCKEAGAIGVILTPGPDYNFEKRDPYAEKYGKRAEQVLKKGRPSLRPRADEKDIYPQLMVSREAIQELYAIADRSWEGDFPPLGHDLDLSVNDRRERVDEATQVNNVCAFWPGSHPELAKDVMIVSAHFDHVGERGGEIFNGADDNASGTTGLLAVAKALEAYGPLQRSVLLLWVSGEEKGLWGSKVWTEAPWLPAGCRAVLDVNIDMIGRTEGDELYITPSREHEAFNSLAGAAYDLAKLEGFAELQSQDEYWRRSDHMNFNDNLKIPVTFLSTGDHPDYHKPTDTAEKIDYEKMSRVVRLVVRLLDRMQSVELGQ